MWCVVPWCGVCGVWYRGVGYVVCSIVVFDIWCAVPMCVVSVCVVCDVGVCGVRYVVSSVVVWGMWYAVSLCGVCGVMYRGVVYVA